MEHCTLVIPQLHQPLDLGEAGLQLAVNLFYTGGVSTGGSTTHVHKLDAYGGANIDLGPNEAGSALIISHNYKRTAAQNAKVDKMTNPEVNTYNMGTTGTASEKHTEPVTLTGQTNTNIDTSLPPYQQVYCWRRTA